MTHTVSLGYLCPDGVSEPETEMSFRMETSGGENVGCFLRLREAEKNAVDLP